MTDTPNPQKNSSMQLTSTRAKLKLISLDSKEMRQSPEHGQDIAKILALTKLLTKTISPKGAPNNKARKK
jgi:hypothetical protein